MFFGKESPALGRLNKHKGGMRIEKALPFKA
jgi:hypothetical protein